MRKALIITPELLKKIGEEAPKSDAAKQKLARANATIAKSKKAIDDFLNKQ